MAERFVQIAKQLLKQSSDLDITLLHYEATPLPWCNRSPSKLLMGRCVRITVPQINSQLILQWPYLKDFQTTDLEFKKRQKWDFDLHNRVSELPEIPDNANVWISSESGPTQGQVVSTGDTPRSYIFDTPTGTV